MKSDLSRPHGYIAPEEFNATLGGLMDKLVDSRSMAYPSLFSHLAEFVVLTGNSYIPSDFVQEKIRQEVETRIRGVLRSQLDENTGKFEPVWGLEDMCQWGINAHQLGISYSLDPTTPDDDSILTPGISRDIATILNFELYHFDYENELNDFGTFFPLDVLYFAQLNGLAEFLTSRIISDLDDRCKMPDTRKATPEESRQRLAEMKKELQHRREDGYDDTGSRELTIQIFEDDLKGIVDERLKLYLNWKTPEGVILCYPDVTDLVVPRQPHSLAQVKEFLGVKLENGLKTYCVDNIYANITQILYRRNRCKEFLGSDINVPLKMADHDDNSFTTLDPAQIRIRIDTLVDLFGPQDLNSELSLPTSLTPQEYRLYRTIHQTMGYVRRGSLTYDTEEKKALLSTSQIPSLDSADLLLMLLESNKVG